MTKFLLALTVLLITDYTVSAFANPLEEISPEAHITCTTDGFSMTQYPFSVGYNSQNSRVELSGAGLKFGSVKLRGSVEFDRQGIDSYEYSIRSETGAVVRVTLNPYARGSFGGPGYRKGNIWYYDGRSYEGVKTVAHITCTESESF